MNRINSFITKQVIPKDTQLKYLITIPCVNREERNAINVIHQTFESFEKSGLFDSDITLHILLFESGSNDLSYLDFINTYKEKYQNKDTTNNTNNIMIQIIKSSTPLTGVSNTLKMFKFIASLPPNIYDFVLWMDDDVFVCKNFIKNANTWIKKYANQSIFSSLYVPYKSYPIQNRNDVKLSQLPGFYGTCCVIFKPALASYVIPYWYDTHFEKFEYNPDTRFRDSVRKQFPKAKYICVSEPSLVQHMNIGSAIKMKKKVNKGHKCHNFNGEEHDPQFYI